MIGIFAQRDLKITWERNPGNTLPFFRYAVEIRVDEELIRLAYVTSPSYTYYYEDMVLDQGTPSREIHVTVFEQSTYIENGLPESATFINPLPVVPTLEIEPFFSSIKLQAVTPDTDVKFRFYKDGVQIYEGPESFYSDYNVVPDEVYDYKVEVFDSFLEDETRSSTIVSASVIPIEISEPEYNVNDIVFSTSSGTTVEWTGGVIYKSENGTIDSKSVASGSGIWSAGILYIYLDWDNGSINTTPNYTTATASLDLRIVGHYKGGETVYIGPQQVIYDGNNIVAGSIAASKLAGTDLITNSAQINNGIIENVQIKSGEITVSKTNTGVFSSSGLNMFGGTIQSDDYVPDVAGWTISENGDAEFNQLLVRESFKTGYRNVTNQVTTLEFETTGEQDLFEHIQFLRTTGFAHFSIRADFQFTRLRWDPTFSIYEGILQLGKTIYQEDTTGVEDPNLIIENPISFIGSTDPRSYEGDFIDIDWGDIGISTLIDTALYTNYYHNKMTFNLTGTILTPGTKFEMRNASITAARIV